MKFEVNVKHFKKLFRPLLNSKYNRETLQINSDTGGLRVKVIRGDVTAQLDLQAQMHQDLKYKCIEGGHGAVNIKSLVWFLKSFLPNETVLLDFPARMSMATTPECNTEVEISIEYAVANNKSLPYSTGKSKFCLDRKSFIDAIKAICFVLGKDRNNYYQGIFFEVSEDNIRCHAGTGFLFAIKNIKCERKKAKKKITFVLPKASLDCISSSLEAVSSPSVTIELFSKGEICLLTSGNLTIRVDNIQPAAPIQIDKVLTYHYPDKLCINISDLKYPIASIRAAAKKETEPFPRPVDINIDSESGKMYFKYEGSASLSVAPLTIDSIIPAATSSPLKLRCQWNYLAELYNRWANQTAITIICEINTTQMFVAKPKHPESVRSDEPDIIFFTATKPKIDPAKQAAEKENKQNADKAKYRLINKLSAVNTTALYKEE